MSEIIPDGLRLPRFTFEQGVLASLFIHGILIVGFILSRTAFIPPEAPHHTLMIQLAGVVSNRQTEPQVAARAVPAAKVNPVNQLPKPTASVKSDLTKAPAHGHSAVQQTAPVHTVSTKHIVALKHTVEPQPVQSGQQLAQRLQQEKADAHDMERYLAALQRVVQRHLIYPDEARAAGDNGSPVVRFSVTADGHLVPGSVAVYRSSGSQALDESARQALLQSGSLPVPPKAMVITISISFAVSDDNEEW